MSHPSLLLIRHGETEWNRLGWYQGKSDPPLSAIGIAQASALATRLACVKATALVSSPLRRAQETAQAIANTSRLPIITDSQLAEISFGKWEGLPQTEVKARWPELLRCWKRTPDKAVFPGGESLPELQQRVRRFLQATANRAQWLPGPVLAIAHDAVIRVALLEAVKAPLSQFRLVQIDNAAVAAFQWCDGGYRIEPRSSPTNTGYNLTRLSRVEAG